ncbi:MAG TPA: hypothetical protein VK108_10750 [Pseudogracilibacillus sp.]|nr:hypothetical protein [Pseudogracilibacillus sp.]
MADDLPAAKSEKENIVAVEESWTAKENEIRRDTAVERDLNEAVH